MSAALSASSSTGAGSADEVPPFGDTSELNCGALFVSLLELFGFNLNYQKV